MNKRVKFFLGRSADILKMYLQTEIEVARLSHSKSTAWTEKIVSRSKVKVNCHQLPNTSSVHHETCNFLPSYINFWLVVFEILRAHTHAHAAKNDTCSYNDVHIKA